MTTLELQKIAAQRLSESQQKIEQDLLSWTHGANVQVLELVKASEKESPVLMFDELLDESDDLYVNALGKPYSLRDTFEEMLFSVILKAAGPMPNGVFNVAEWVDAIAASRLSGFDDLVIDNVRSAFNMPLAAN